MHAAAVMAMAPPAMRDDAAAQLDYFGAIAGAGVPIVLQNAPPPAGCGLDPDRTLAIVDQVAGIAYVTEETLPCGQRISRVLAAQHPRLRGVFGGASRAILGTSCA